MHCLAMPAMAVHSLPCCLAASELDSARQNETLSAVELGFDMKNVEKLQIIKKSLCTLVTNEYVHSRIADHATMKPFLLLTLLHLVPPQYRRDFTECRF